MKRNMELIRQLAIHIEAASGLLPSNEIEIDPYSQDEITYHSGLMNEANLIVTGDVADDGDMLIERLTWSGHDFLDAAKDDKLWNRVTKTIKERVTSVTFDGLMSLLKVSAQRVLTEGVDLLR